MKVPIELLSNHQFFELLTTKNNMETYYVRRAHGDIKRGMVTISFHKKEFDVTIVVVYLFETSQNATVAKAVFEVLKLNKHLEKVEVKISKNIEKTKFLTNIVHIKFRKKS